MAACGDRAANCKSISPRVPVFLFRRKWQGAACLLSGWIATARVGRRNECYFDYRWSGGAATPLAALAAELVSLNPDLIVVASTPGTQAMQKATGQIPVVFVGVSDPVASGIVASLARPKANITGVSNFLPATSGKLIELLRTMVPTASRFVVLRDPNNAGKQLELAELKQAAHEMGVALEAVDARAINEVEGALSAIAAMGADALYHATRRRNIDKSLSDR